MSLSPPPYFQDVRFYKFPEKGFDFIVMSHKCLRSLLQLGCGRLALERINTEGVDPMVEAMSKTHSSW